MKHNTDITSNQHGGNAESISAHEPNPAHRDTQGAQVLALIQASPDGLTMKQVAAELGVPFNACSGRGSELKKAGAIVKSGLVRDGSAVLLAVGNFFHIGGLVTTTQTSYIGDRPSCSLPVPMAPSSPAKATFAPTEDTDPFESQRAAHSRYEMQQ